MAETSDGNPSGKDNGNSFVGSGIASGNERGQGGIGGAEKFTDPAAAIGTKPAANIFDAGIDVTASLDTGPRKRGRPRGSTTKARPLDISGIEKILLSMHAMAAASLSIPELMLDDKEAKQLADAANDVAQHYAVAIDPRTLAWVNLIFALTIVYGTRIVAIGARKKNERKKRQAEREADSVVQFPGAS